MADSENSRTLPSITRRNLLSLAVASLAASAAKPALGELTLDIDAENNGDLIVPAWRAWNEAHKQHYELCRRQQKLETAMLKMVGGRFPRVEIQVADKTEPVFARTAREINHLLRGAELADRRRQAKAELSTRLAAWDAADAQIGYTIAYDAQSEMADTENALAEALKSIPAQSIVGVIAKLHAVIEMEDPGACLTETPWPELRSILVDILRLNASTFSI